ncbi:MAG: peptidoglycan bridge formation glycyltransferase FemA/FemB family protein, partial [Patescibacteria group bacterium]
MKQNEANRPYSGAFLQSREWGAFQEAVGRRVERVRVGDHETALQWVQLPFGLRYAHAARVDFDDVGWQQIVAHARKGGAVFMRIEPLTDAPMDSAARKVRDHHPSTTRIIDLSASEEQLLAQMKQKTRYNIRLAAKHGVVVSEASGVWGVRRFLKLLAETKERQRFTVHAPAYYEKMLETLGAGDAPVPARCEARLFVARYNGKVRAANIVISYGDTVTYLHGASSDKDHEVMAPYLLHWMTMLWAKKCGFRWYDLWGCLTGRASAGPGVAPPPHPSPLPRVEREIIHPL